MENELNVGVIEEIIRVASDNARELNDRELDGIYRVSRERVRVNGFVNPLVSKLEGFRADAFGKEITRRNVERQIKEALAFCRGINDEEFRNAYLNFDGIDYVSDPGKISVKPNGLIESKMGVDYFINVALNKVASERPEALYKPGGLIAERLN